MDIIPHVAPQIGILVIVGCCFFLALLAIVRSAL